MEPENTPNTDSDQKRAWRMFRLLVLLFLAGLFYMIVSEMDSTVDPSMMFRVTSGKEYAVGKLVRVFRTPETIATGEVLSAACRGCHGPGLKGGVGPNLMDRKWLHKVAAERALYRLVRNGVGSGKLKFGRKQNLMPPRGLLASNADVWKVVFYLSSINHSIQKDGQ